MVTASKRSTVFLGLGSNLGDRRRSLCQAMELLAAHEGIAIDERNGVASLYETRPVGGPPGQAHYLNSAVRVSTTLEPVKLLSAIHCVESSLGRKREERWAARKIDVDILLYDDLVLDSGHLTLPHPRLHERRFVLAPLCEIAADIMHPVLRVSIGHLTQALPTCSGQDDVKIMQAAGWYDAWLRVNTSDAGMAGGA